MTGFDHRQADFGVGEFSPQNAPAPTAFYGAVPTIPVREIILAIAVLVSSTLYLAGVIAVAIAWDNHVAASEKLPPLTDAAIAGLMRNAQPLSLGYMNDLIYGAEYMPSRYAWFDGLNWDTFALANIDTRPL